MSKRISPTQKFCNLMSEVKEATIAIMKKHGLTEMEISGVTNLQHTKKEWKDCEVTKVYIEKGNDGTDILQFDDTGVSAYYYNPVIWLEIHDRVFWQLNEYSKTYKAME